MQFVRDEADYAECVLESTTLRQANDVRRVILRDLDTVAVASIQVICNTSARYTSEQVAHLLAMRTIFACDAENHACDSTSDSAACSKSNMREYHTTDNNSHAIGATNLEYVDLLDNLVHPDTCDCEGTQCPRCTLIYQLDVYCDAATSNYQVRARDLHYIAPKQSQLVFAPLITHDHLNFDTIESTATLDFVHDHAFAIVNAQHAYWKNMMQLNAMQMDTAELASDPTLWTELECTVQKALPAPLNPREPDMPLFVLEPRECCKLIVYVQRGHTSEHVKFNPTTSVAVRPLVRVQSRLSCANMNTEHVDINKMELLSTATPPAWFTPAVRHQFFTNECPARVFSTLGDIEDWAACNNCGACDQWTWTHIARTCVKKNWLPIHAISERSTTHATTSQASEHSIVHRSISAEAAVLCVQTRGHYSPKHTIYKALALIASRKRDAGGLESSMHESSATPSPSNGITA